MTFDYFCDSCRKVKDNHQMKSFECKCGGTMQLLKNVDMIAFEPFYSKDLKAYITSVKQEERLLKKKGLSYMADHHGMQKEADYIRKHKEEHVRSEYAKVGLKYTPNSGMRLDEKLGAFVPQGGHRRRCMVTVSLVLAFLLQLTFFLNTGFAFTKIHPDVEYATVKIHGKDISFPIGNDQRKNDVYYLKRLLHGDRDAREIFLGGEKVRYFPIGDTFARWVKVTNHTEEVIDGK